MFRCSVQVDLSSLGCVSLLPQSGILRWCSSMCRACGLPCWKVPCGTIIWTLGLEHLGIRTAHPAAPIFKDVKNNILISAHMGFPGLLLQAITVWRSQDRRRQKALVPRAPWLIGVLDNFPSSLSCSSQPLKSRGWKTTELSGR